LCSLCGELFLCLSDRPQMGPSLLDKLTAFVSVIHAFTSLLPTNELHSIDRFCEQEQCARTLETKGK